MFSSLTPEDRPSKEWWSCKTRL